MDPVAMCFPAEGWWYVMAMHDDSWAVGCGLWAVGAGGGSGGCLRCAMCGVRCAMCDVRRPRGLDGTDRAEESIVLASELN